MNFTPKKLITLMMDAEQIIADLYKLYSEAGTFFETKKVFKELDEDIRATLSTFKKVVSDIGKREDEAVIKAALDEFQEKFNDMLFKFFDLHSVNLNSIAFQKTLGKVVFDISKLVEDFMS